MEYTELTIILPIYNVESFLEPCLISLLEIEQFENIEVLLVNDGSTDASGKIADSFSQKYSNVTVFHKENGGLSDARNYGLRHAKGEFVFFLDSDDMIDGARFNKVLKIIRENSGDIVLWDAKIVNEKGQYINTKEEQYYSHSGVKENTIYSGEDIIELQLKDHGDFVTTVWLGAYNRNFLLSNNLFFEKGLLHEDELWTVKVFLLAQRIIYIKEKLYLYRQRGGSIMTITSGDKSKNLNAAVYIYATLYSYIDWKINNRSFAKLVKGNISKRYLHTLAKFNVGRYNGIVKKINAIDIFKNSISSIDKIRALILIISPKLYCYISSIKYKKPTRLRKVRCIDECK